MITTLHEKENDPCLDLERVLCEWSTCSRIVQFISTWQHVSRQFTGRSIYDRWQSVVCLTSLVESNSIGNLCRTPRTVGLNHNTIKFDLSIEDLKCLNEGEFLNDNIIDFYLQSVPLIAREAQFNNTWCYLDMSTMKNYQKKIVNELIFSTHSFIHDWHGKATMMYRIFRKYLWKLIGNTLSVTCWSTEPLNDDTAEWNDGSVMWISFPKIFSLYPSIKQLIGLLFWSSTTIMYLLKVIWSVTMRMLTIKVYRMDRGFILIDRLLHCSSGAK